MSVRLRKSVVVMLGTLTVIVFSTPILVGIVAEEVKSQSRALTPTNEMQQIARLTVANELMRLHWTSWVTGKELRKIANESAKGINDQLENRPDVNFLLPKAGSKQQIHTELEKRAVKSIRAGVAEVWYENSKKVQYVRGIRSTRTCLQCHRPMNDPNGELNEGDLLGVISVRLTM